MLTHANRPLLCAATFLASLLLAGCSGSGSSSGGSTTTPPHTGAANTVPIVVDLGPAQTGGTRNVLYTTVTLCAHGSTSNCQTIDHVQVDTGSVGFRVLSEALTLNGLPATTDGSGNTLLECTRFADGYSWGQLSTVDLTVGGLTAVSLPIQIIGSATYAGWVPPSCTGGLSPENGVATFGANAILGVGPFLQDCGDNCASGEQTGGAYYSCTAAGSCTPTTVSTVAQVQNPVTLFPSDNNGIAIQLPVVSPPGQATVSGTLYFGIATEGNNGLTSGAKLYGLDGTGAFASTTYNGTSYQGSFLDSGSNAYFFPDSTIPVCAAPANGFYCPGATEDLSAQVTGTGTHGNSSTVKFVIDQATTLFNYNYSALPTLAGPASSMLQTFDWGLPFYYGRVTFEAFEGQSVNGVSTPGPWVGW